MMLRCYQIHQTQFRQVAFGLRSSLESSASSGDRIPISVKTRVTDHHRSQLLLSSTAPPPLIDAANSRLGFRQSPQLALFSLLFVLSAVFGSFLSLAIVSIPTMNAFRKLSISMDKLSRVVSEEVPGTLSSLKLSGLEINELTQQLNTLRHKITGSKHAKDGGARKSSSRKS